MTAAEPEVARGRKFTAVWIIPLIAVAIGAWMVVWTYMTEGPEIRVTFETAQGLAEGKTVVKFRDVEMGQVQEVLLSDDMQSVTAVIKMRREALTMLREDTRFWVVTAQIGGGGISGLETILSGAYIELAPGTSNIEAREFVGLEKPPLTPADAPGLRLVLLSERASSVTTGDPVLYHGFKVGRVESLTFDLETRQIRNEIFIDAPIDSARWRHLRYSARSRGGHPGREQYRIPPVFELPGYPRNPAPAP
jgi:paraquat-inducible protein B